MLLVVRRPATTEAAVAGAAAAAAEFVDGFGPLALACSLAFCAFFLPPLDPAVGSPVTTAVAGVDTTGVAADMDTDRAGPAAFAAAAEGDRVPAATLENPVTLAEAERFSDGLPI